MLDRPGSLFAAPAIGRGSGLRCDRCDPAFVVNVPPRSLEGLKRASEEFTKHLLDAHGIVRARPDHAARNGARPWDGQRYGKPRAPAAAAKARR